MRKIVIIGGGAAGMMAAIAAAKRGHEVIIVERMKRVGKKLLTTGNGRCNITNENINISRYHGKNKNEILKAFYVFSSEDTLNFFNSIGISTKIENSGKTYPLSEQASSVIDNFRYELARLGVVELCEFDVKTIEHRNGKFSITSHDGQKLFSDKVILATGGKAASALGSNGSGYELAQKFGHHIVSQFPSLTKINLYADYLKGIAGVKFDGNIAAKVSNDKLTSGIDEILFTNSGISGPAVFEVSRKISEAVHHNVPVTVELDLFFSHSKGELFQMFSERANVLAHRTSEEFMIGMVNKKLICVLLEICKISRAKMASELSKKEISTLVDVLKGWEFAVKSVAGFADAQVCTGGVDTTEIDYKTMQSKKCKGLFIVGELMDIDGDCGGFNLQWAWTSGYIAGNNV